jgi:hypothetical protein
MRRLQGEDIPVALNFKTGTDIAITGFDYFTKITATCNTVNYPINDLTLAITDQQITTKVTKEMTANMYGQLFLNLTFVGGGNTFKKKFATEITIAQP